MAKYEEDDATIRQQWHAYTTDPESGYDPVWPPYRKWAQFNGWRYARGFKAVMYPRWRRLFL